MYCLHNSFGRAFDFQSSELSSSPQLRNAEVKFFVAKKCSPHLFQMEVLAVPCKEQVYILVMRPRNKTGTVGCHCITELLFKMVLNQTSRFSLSIDQTIHTNNCWDIRIELYGIRSIMLVIAGWNTAEGLEV